MFTVFRRPAVRITLAAPLALLLLLTLGLAFVSINRLSVMEDRAAAIRSMWLPSVGVQGHLLGTVERFRTAQLQYATIDSANRKRADGELLQSLQDVEQARKSYEPYIARNTDDEKFMNEYDQVWAKYKRANQRLIDGRMDLPGLLDKEVLTSFREVRGALQNDLTFNLVMGLTTSDEIDTIYADARLIIIGLEFAITAAGLWLGYAIVMDKSARSAN